MRSCGRNNIKWKKCNAVQYFRKNKHARRELQFIKRMYKIGRPHFPRDVFDTVVRRGVRLNADPLNILSGATQRWVRRIFTPDPSAEYTAADSLQKYNIIGSHPDTSHECRHPRWTVCQALNLFFKQESLGMSLSAACGTISREYLGRGVSTRSAKALYEGLLCVGGYDVAHRRRGTAVRLRKCVVTKLRTRHVTEHGERDH